MRKNTWYRMATCIAISAAMFSAACAKEAPKSDDHDDDDDKKSVSSPSVKPTGRIITIEAYSDAAGNYFKPTEVEAHRGDVVRFVLKSGVHNVNFLADSNPGASFLPPPSEMLQLPEQTHDVLIAMEKGRYFFQCDPHALIGMVGRIKVED